MIIPHGIMHSQSSLGVKQISVNRQLFFGVIPIDELPALNRDFKRYIRILHENDIHTTADMITAYLSCSIGGIKGLGRKFYITLKDFISHQRQYQEDYKKLHETANAAWEATVS